MKTNIETIDEALHIAIKYEAFHGNTKKSALRYQAVDNQNSGDMGTNKKCFRCGGRGHLRKDCPVDQIYNN